MVNENIYLNYGAAGKYSVEVLRVINNYLQLETDLGGAAEEIIDKREATLYDSRKKFSKLINCQSEEITLTSNTTEGVNIAAYGIELKFGDEVIITDEEHYSCLIPWINVEKLKGIKIKNISINELSDNEGNLKEEKFLQHLQALINDKTKAVFLSHILWTTGIELPVRNICKFVKNINPNIMIIIDGAQTIGHIEVDVKQIGCDFYSFTGGKWLNAPMGTGGLYINSQIISDVKSIYCGWNSVIYDKNLTFRDDARRFEVSTRSMAILCGLNKAIDIYQCKKANSDRYTNANLIRKFLIHNKYYNVMAPNNQNAMITFKHKHKNCEVLYKQFSELGILCKKVYNKDAIRFSMPIFNLDSLNIEKVYGTLENIAIK